VGRDRSRDGQSVGSDLGAENFMLGPIDRGLEGQEEERSAYRGAMDEEDAAEA
jgi:hypothetical protein